MKHPDNIGELVKLPIDYIGFILYPKSPRYFLSDDTMIIQERSYEAFAEIPPRIKRVGVLVNNTPSEVFACIKNIKFDAVQLHGNETPEDCRMIKEILPDIEIIKAFNVSDISDFDRVKEYDVYADYFLFDTKTSQYGGSGKKFDWNILKAYAGQTPFLLSGGITIDDADIIKEIKHPKLYGIDLNSKFETEPGFKDIELLKKFIKQLQDE